MKELKKLKSRIKRDEETDGYLKMYYICPETHRKTLFLLIIILTKLWKLKNHPRQTWKERNPHGC